jgi:squalene-hopene/tetraprenyl-beta-curcumene cyclase
MSLAATGREDHPVADAAVRFLQESMRPEGSWPIDTNLATWVTSLSVHALSVADAALAATSPRATPGEEAVATGKPQDQNWASPALLSWLLDCQHRHRHPFTGADPGGWGWSDLSGAVPDGDDTPAAIIALAHCRVSGKVPSALLSRVEEAQVMGMRWLLRLQNRDGGWPTFCRGWGKLPFDRSSTDLTAHALRALAWGDGSCGSAAGSTAVRRRAVRRGWEFLRRRQRADGALLPLWFGNQDEPDDENPVYGSARVLVSAPLMERSEPQNRLEQWRLLRGAAEYLLNSQRNDGGWGGGASRSSWCAAGTIADTGPGGESVGSGVLAPTSSVEETAQALEGLAEWYAAASRCVGRNANAPGGRLSGSWQEIRRNWLASGEPACRAAIIRGLGFVCEAVRQAKHHDPWPIGFYFAKLWYHEKLYPIVFATAAIGAALRALSQTPASSDEPL